MNSSMFKKLGSAPGGFWVAMFVAFCLFVAVACDFASGEDSESDSESTTSTSSSSASLTSYSLEGESTISLVFSSAVSLSDVVLSEVSESSGAQEDSGTEESESEDSSSEESAKSESVSDSDIEPSSDKTQVTITLPFKTELGRQYVLSWTASGSEGSLTFSGYNEEPARLILSEVRSANSDKKAEYIEFCVLKGGNTSGLEIWSGYYGEDKKYSFPSIDVETGEYITVHYRTLESETSIDETGSDLTLSTAEASCDTARDLWINTTEKGIAKENDIIVLRGANSNEIIDAVLYAKSTASEWTGKRESLAIEAYESGVWLGGSGVAHAACSDNVTPIKTLSRLNVADIIKSYSGTDDLITVSKDDWEIVETGTPGYENVSNDSDTSGGETETDGTTGSGSTTEDSLTDSGTGDSDASTDSDSSSDTLTDSGSDDEKDEKTEETDSDDDNSDSNGGETEDTDNSGSTSGTDDSDTSTDSNSVDSDTSGGETDSDDSIEEESEGSEETEETDSDDDNSDSSDSESTTARLILSEVRSEHTSARADFIEFYVLKGGNTAGIEILSGAGGKEIKYSFPSIEVSTGEYITVHYQVIDSDTSIDETEDDLTLSTAKYDTCDTARDLWFADSAITTRDVIVLFDANTEKVIDAVLFAESSQTSWYYSRLKTLAAEAYESGVWLGGSDVEYAACVDNVKYNKTLSRLNVADIIASYSGSDDLITVSKDDWAIVTSATAGYENDTTLYSAE